MKKLLVTFLLILSMLLIACGARELGNSEPPSNDLGAPAGETSGEGESAPVEGGESEVAPVEGGEAAPAEGGEAAPAEGGEGEAAPVEGGEAAPAEGGEGEAAPAEGGEAAPAEGEAAPAEGGEAAPAEGGEGEAAPAEGGEAAPAEGEAAPAEGGEAAPAEGGEGEAAPAEGGEAAAPAVEGEQTHVVQPGDTTSEIAKAYGVTVEDIQAANGLFNINAITVGQTLKIIAGAATAGDTGEAPAPVSGFDPERYLSHTISYGETLFTIGRAYGFTVDELMGFNGLSGTRIDAGQVLKIPIR